MVGREAFGPPWTDIRRHPIRLSRGELVSTRAYLRLAGRLSEYTNDLLSIGLGLACARKDPCSAPGRLRVNRLGLPGQLAKWFEGRGLGSLDGLIKDGLLSMVQVDIPFGHDVDGDAL